MAAVSAAQLQALITRILGGSMGAPAAWQWNCRCLRLEVASECGAAGVEAATLHKLLAALQDFVLRHACPFVFRLYYFV